MTEQEKRTKVIAELERVADEANLWKESPPLRCDISYPLLIDALALLKAQETCEDAVNRKDVINVIKSPCDMRYINGNWQPCIGDYIEAINNLPAAAPKAHEPRVMTLDLPPEEWQDKVIWLEIKGKKPIPCLFRKFCDRMMFGRYERIMSFDAIGSSKEGGYFLRKYGVTWRCWTSRPTDEQREVTPW